MTVLGLHNDVENKIQLVIDRPIYEGRLVSCHPCISTSTLTMTREDMLEKLLPAIHHAPIVGRSARSGGGAVRTVSITTPVQDRHRAWLEAAAAGRCTLVYGRDAGAEAVIGDLEPRELADYKGLRWFHLVWAGIDKFTAADVPAGAVMTNGSGVYGAMIAEAYAGLYPLPLPPAAPLRRPPAAAPLGSPLAGVHPGGGRPC